MTIIRPSAHKSYLSFFALIFFLILAFGIFYIFEYNAFAASRLEAKDLKQKIVALQSVNADLKDAFYKAVDTSNLETIAEEKGLYLDKRPEYLNVNLWLSDSSR